MEEPSVAFVGDIMLSRGVGARLESWPDVPILGEDVIDLLSRADYRIGNLECPISATADLRRAGLFRADPSALEQLRHFDLLTLANNHIHDCGRQGVQDTCAALDAAGYAHTGLCHEDGTQSLLTCTVKGLRLAIIAMARPECIPVSESGRWGVNRTDDPNTFASIVRARQTHDKVIAIIHGGNEMIPEPPPTLINLAHDMVDAGADLVITHHPHVLGGMETYKHAPIFYSLGDFVFDGQSRIRRRGAVLMVRFGKQQTNWEMTSTAIGSELTVDIAESDSAQNAKKEFERVSQLVSSDGYTSRYDRLYRLSMFRFQLDRVYFLLRNKGLTYAFTFALSRLRLVPHYFKSILNRLHR